jgi:hypothetical protein
MKPPYVSGLLFIFMEANSFSRAFVGTGQPDIRIRDGLNSETSPTIIQIMKSELIMGYSIPCKYVVDLKLVDWRLRFSWTIAEILVKFSLYLFVSLSLLSAYTVYALCIDHEQKYRTLYSSITLFFFGGVICTQPIRRPYPKSKLRFERASSEREYLT